MTTPVPPHPRPFQAAIPCLRTGNPREVPEHLVCPYCSGDATAVRSGQRARFCEYQPGRDPIAFGFPADCARATHG